MLTASALYRQAIPYPHRRVTRVRVYQGGVLVADSDPGTAVSQPGLLPVSGSVEASLTARVTRTMTMATDPALFSEAVNGLLSAYESVLQVDTGIGYPDGSREIFPVFRGRVYESNRSADGGVEVRCEDLAADVVDCQFEQPQVSVTTNTVVQEIHRLIRQVLPSAVFGTDDVSAVALTPTLVWDTDRGKALDDLAAAVKGRWYALGDGTFVIRQYPYAAGTPVLTLADGSGGVNMTADRTTSRIGCANSVVVVAERMDGTAPIRAVARDINPASPTYWGGPFGKPTIVIKVQTPLTQGQAEQLAQAQLAARTALSEQWSINCVPDYTIEPGDTINVSYRGVDAVQVVDRITYPLTERDAMQLSTRSSVPEPIGT